MHVGLNVDIEENLFLVQSPIDICRRVLFDCELKKFIQLMISARLDQCCEYHRNFEQQMELKRIHSKDYFKA